MADYRNEKCPVCGEIFSDGDDIVVCPECGTPHHRECYFEKGECANKSLHESGYSWEPEQKQDHTSSDEKSEAGKVCSSCGAVNKAHTLICERCGHPMIERRADAGGDRNDYGKNGFPFGGMGMDFDSRFCGMNPDEKIAGVKISNVSEFVGTNKYYYLPMFKRMSDSGKIVSFNFVCLFFPQFYFANRKMWLFAALTTIITFVLSVPTLMYYMADMNIAGDFLKGIDFNGVSFIMLSRLTYYLNMAFKVLVCLFANWIYYRHVLKRIRNIENASDSSEASEASIKKYGGTSAPGMIMTLLVQMAITFIFMFFFKIY